MSAEALNTLLRDIKSSGAFAAQIGSDPAIATGYDLSPEERDALLRHDREALRRLGGDPELLDAVDSMGTTQPPRQ